MTDTPPTDAELDYIEARAETYPRCMECHQITTAALVYVDRRTLILKFNCANCAARTGKSPVNVVMYNLADVPRLVAEVRRLRRLPGMLKEKQG